MTKKKFRKNRFTWDKTDIRIIPDKESKEKSKGDSNLDDALKNVIDKLTKK